MNEKLAHRICHLLAIAYAIPVEEVWEIYQSNNSIDQTNEMVKEMS